MGPNRAAETPHPEHTYDYKDDYNGYRGRPPRDHVPNPTETFIRNEAIHRPDAIHNIAPARGDGAPSETVQARPRLVDQKAQHKVANEAAMSKGA